MKKKTGDHKTSIQAKNSEGKLVNRLSKNTKQRPRMLCVKLGKQFLPGQTSPETLLGDTRYIVDMTILFMDVAPNSDKLPAANSVLNLVHNHEKPSGSETRFSNGENVVSSLVDGLPDSEELRPKTS